MNDNQEITTASRHEVLHLAYVVGDMFGRHLLDHRAVQGDPVLLAKAEQIIDLLGDFYQAVKQPLTPGDQ